MPFKKENKFGMQFKKGHIPWNKGLKEVQESTRKDKTYNEIFGKRKAIEIRKQISKTSKKRIDNILNLKKLWENKKFRNKIKKAVSKANKNRKATKETLKKLSKATKGKNNPRYIDGRTNKWKKVRKQCFERDNYICQICYKRGNVYLNCHHIINKKLCRDSHLYITNIEFTDKYNDYKDKFKNIIQKEK
jgi:5-methylcytosine-specific restriction endonuclease McrA